MSRHNSNGNVLTAIQNGTVANGNGLAKVKAKHGYQAPIIQHLSAKGTQGITFISGPAGTGKTYLAVKCLVQRLEKGEFKKLIMVRPAVSAGEDLGFLPGDMQAKVDPFLLPIRDILGELGYTASKIKEFIDDEKFEIATIAHMRGRTLADAATICDEAQNLTWAQLKMVTTRTGVNSHLVLTGDPYQSDLSDGRDNAFGALVQTLEKNKGTHLRTFSIPADAKTCRSPAVQEITGIFNALENVPEPARNGATPTHDAPRRDY